tara:strand:+ start:3112 stop:3498 length:387 start_codon:yes stop_codon:yes gene_type:complete
MNYNILETRPASNGKIYYDIEILSIDKIFTFKFDADISDDLIESEVTRFVEDYERSLSIAPIMKEFDSKQLQRLEYSEKIGEIELLVGEEGLEDEKIIEYTEEIERIENLITKIDEECDILLIQMNEI